MGLTSKTTPRAGRTSRRDAMLDAAATLFSSRGYVDTGIDDIGEAVGVTGPAVYRHFASKDAVLVAVLERAIEHSAAIVPRVEEEATSPEDALERLVEYTVAECIADRELTAIYWQESRNLPTSQRRRFERVQRELIDAYAQILRTVRPELGPSEARMAVYAASALMRSVANRESSLSEAAQQRLLSSMARAALSGAQPDADAPA
jgi:AcrR family transcriptional regulator